MPYYQRLGQIPKKHHIWFHRNGAAPSYKNEGIAYEHVFTTEGFDEAYSIVYHLRPPTRVRNVELIKHWEPKKSPIVRCVIIILRPRTSRAAAISTPAAFRCCSIRTSPRIARGRPKPTTSSSITRMVEPTKSSSSSRAAAHSNRFRQAALSRGRLHRHSARNSYRLVPDKVENEGDLILESAGPVRIPKRYLDREGRIEMGTAFPTALFMDRRRSSPSTRRRMSMCWLRIARVSHA